MKRSTHNKFRVAANFANNRRQLIAHWGVERSRDESREISPLTLLAQPRALRAVNGFSIGNQPRPEIRRKEISSHCCNPSGKILFRPPLSNPRLIHYRFAPAFTSIAATRSLEPDPHREMALIACVKGIFSGCTRSEASM